MFATAIPKQLFIGLMSGTSLDGVDGVLADFNGAQPQVLAHLAMPFAPALKQELLALNTTSDNELQRAALAAMVWYVCMRKLCKLC